MNSNDISRLSYKELQALALRYRVPGNIKKKLLVKVLQAAKGGNENEVGRLLQDLKQNRKKRVRKIKAGKLGITSTPLHSPNYVMADDYYCPQQQPPYQWIGAEEEIASRDEDTRIPHYEEFKQFLLRRIQREFHTYDTNNNQVQESAIVDLRTVATSSNIQAVPIDTSSYSRPNIITVNNADSYVYHTNDNMEYQTLEDPNGNAQGSILLKKMLQAPVGANLGEIASPVFGGYRLWSMEQYQSNNLLDNSDTLTAESENEENECNLENNAECYGLLNSIKGEYFLNEPTFVRNVEEIGEQISNVLTNDNSNQCRYSATAADIRQSYENWAVSNVIEATDNNCSSGDGQGSKIVQTMYYNNAGSESLNKPPHNDNLPCQYRMTDNAHSYNSNQDLLNMNPSEESQYYETNMISSMQSDSPNAYYLQNLVKYNGEAAGQYFHNVHSLQNINVEQDPYASAVTHTFPNDTQYNPNLHGEYSYAHANQDNSVPLSENLEQQQQNETMTRHDSSIKDSLQNPDRSQATNGVLEPFWPKWYTKSQSGTILENILNLYSPKRVDLARLDQTSCVYSYIAPIVTHTAALPNSVCSQKEKYVAEYRQHSFSPHWLLYNDTSCGMRMANLPGKLDTEDGLTASSRGIPDARETVVIEDSVEETWSQDYEKDVNICEGLNVEATDCLFSVITTEPLDTHADNASTSESQ